MPQYHSIAQLHKAIAASETTVAEVTKGHLDRIEKLDGQLNAITVVNKNALRDAEKLDALPAEQRGPLHGLPIVIKDQAETAGIATAFGSKACKDYIPKEDATVVRRLKEAGAVILAKTTMPDWAASWFSLSSLSESTKHPIDPTRDPGGSSSGSGTAVAAEMALAAIGEDTGGSIRLPSSFCGLVGVRVTPGRISRNGMSSLVKTQDTPGPMCKSVEDAARILDVLVGYDEQDEFTSINALARRIPSPTPFMDAIKNPQLAGKRLGVLRQAFGSQQGINNVLSTTLSHLHSAGAELIDVEIPDLEYFIETTAIYILRSRNDINQFCASREELKHLKIENLHAEGIYHPTLDLIDALARSPADPHDSLHFGKALTESQRFQRVVAGVFAKHHLDAMIYPTCQLLAPKTQDLLNMRWTGPDYPTNTPIGSQLLWTAISMPIGKAKDDEYPEDPELPVGLEILGVPLGEEKILNLAAGVEALVSKA